MQQSGLKVLSRQTRRVWERRGLVSALAALALLFVACSTTDMKKNPVSMVYEGVSEDLRTKQITPEMTVRMERLEKAGCDETFKVKDPKMGKIMSFIPGGGQFYNDEPVKGIYYMATSIFIIPYIIAIEDAKKTREYLNFQSTMEFCEEKLRLSGKKLRE